MKLAENSEDNTKVSMAMISINGFKKNGTYYIVNFKVKDASSDIKLDLVVKEASKEDGSDIKYSTSGTTIKMENNKKSDDNNTSEKNVITELPKLEVKNIDELSTIEEIITNNTKTSFKATDKITGTSSNEDIVHISEDGTIVPTGSGTAVVTVALNDGKVGNMLVTVANDEISSIKTIDEAEANSYISNSENNKKLEETTSSLQKEGNYQEPNISENTDEIELIENEDIENNSNNLKETKNKDKQKSEKKQNKSTLGIICVLIILFVIILFIIKKRMGGKK